MAIGKIFLTGATGYVGERLALRLAEEGWEVHALFRDKAKAAALSHPRIRLFPGDVTQPQSLEAACAGCDTVIHTAAFLAVWTRDRSLFDKVNVGGTQAVWHAAREAGTQTFIYTSTAGSLGPSAGELVQEDSPRRFPFFNDYERSKAEAEAWLLGQPPAMRTMVLHLTRVFGPGQLSEANATTRLMKQVAEGRWRIIPGGGEKQGNYVYIEDVIEGHLLALAAGKPGERYIIGGENLSFDAFFQRVRALAGSKQRFFHLPTPLILASAHLMELAARWGGIQPAITPAWARRYLFDWKLSSDKALRELGYRSRPFDEAAQSTLAWLSRLNP
jgi:farnesol dehydrogenase